MIKYFLIALFLMSSQICMGEGSARFDRLLDEPDNPNPYTYEGCMNECMYACRARIMRMSLDHGNPRNLAPQDEEACRIGCETQCQYHPQPQPN